MSGYFKMDPDCPGPVFEVNGNITVHQPLSEQDLNAARNGKLLKKLRDIKALCPGTCLKFNQSLKVIEISGASDDVHMAQEKVQECTGPTKSISLAVWCELLRTRKGFGALGLIQVLTSCRVHVDRHRQRVKLFGTPHAIAWASTLLQNLEEMCTEKQVAAIHGCDMEPLTRIARQTCVTLRVHDSQLCIIGFKTAVQDATAEIERCTPSPHLSNDYVNLSNTSAQEVKHVQSLLPLAASWNAEFRRANPQILASGLVGHVASGHHPAVPRPR
mmetsp:Transcript_49430/g.100389  ORF Transcript_49430/g.100389 Transcript_49430/m.100389 type:complete len:273 (+) Transcript_49430:39-857(+)